MDARKSVVRGGARVHPSSLLSSRDALHVVLSPAVGAARLVWPLEWPAAASSSLACMLLNQVVVWCLVWCILSQPACAANADMTTSQPIRKTFGRVFLRVVLAVWAANAALQLLWVLWSREPTLPGGGPLPSQTENLTVA